LEGSNFRNISSSFVGLHKFGENRENLIENEETYCYNHIKLIKKEQINDKASAEFDVGGGAAVHSDAAAGDGCHTYGCQSGMY
jgi:hypothetical protein